MRTECKADVYLPYAQWLLSQDRFDDARMAYKEAGRPDLSSRMLEQLTHNAVVEKRFDDASFYFYQLATEALAVSPSTALQDAVNRPRPGYTTKTAAKEQRSTLAAGFVVACRQANPDTHVSELGGRTGADCTCAVTASKLDSLRIIQTAARINHCVDVMSTAR